jgi:hypothetical protein
MASYGSIYFKKEKLQEMLAKCGNGISIEISIQDEANNFGQNMSCYLSQTKDEREAKAPRNYVANGNIHWTDGKIVAFKKEAKSKDNF